MKTAKKICILGNYSGTLDEGMANVSYHMYTNLSNIYSNVFLLNVKEAKKPSFWVRIFRIRPSIIHYIPGPSTKSLLLVKLIQLLVGSRTIISATQPTLNVDRFRSLLILAKPDMVCVQSRKSELLFAKLNCRTRFVPNGVDTERFVPVSRDKRNEIRERYGFSVNDFIILHIGPIKDGRNQKSLLQIPNSKKLLIVSITNPSEQKAYEELNKTDVIIWKEYFPNIQDMYSMADVYVWPAFDEFHGIEIPLTVLEAMSCNLPVISTRYGALERLFQEGDGLAYIDSADQIQAIIQNLRNGNVVVNTREKIQLFSWKSIAHEISKIYEEILEDQKE